jgi:hypothetical protein
MLQYKSTTQQKLNQGTNVRFPPTLFKIKKLRRAAITLYPFINSQFVISRNSQRLKIIQLLTGLPSGHFYFFTEKHLQWLIPMKA